ncbi:MAG TPA: F0F1 ATP synthase subunit gamma, partial [bacterium]|nr:F0F1 ATP synthase subunit gamma [bacterium]
MPTLQDIKKRITSIKSTQKITRAMKMVSAAKLRRAQQSLNNHRPFANKLDELVGLILMLSDERQTPALMIPHDHQHNLELLVFTSNRGLCGGFNANLMRHTESVLKQLKHDQKKTTLQIIGRKGRAFLTARKIPIDHYWPDYADTLTFSQASVLATEAINRFTQHESDSFSLVYNQFESAASHKIVTKQILPIALSSREDTPDLARQYCFDFIYEPDRISFLHQL